MRKKKVVTIRIILLVSFSPLNKASISVEKETTSWVRSDPQQELKELPFVSVTALGFGHKALYLLCFVFSSTKWR